ncbi:hypothetical protein [Stenotrophomonas sp.]|uniref:hypothetical protein n=1 Tax=Stenotrophomonas sp. TaxID=69392 RepID=UPI0028AD65D1|nr:hypothetical protein [Stenotrophomonas sp.]
MSKASLTPHRFGVPSHARQISEAALKKVQAWTPEPKRTPHPKASKQHACSPDQSKFAVATSAIAAPLKQSALRPSRHPNLTGF